MAHLLNVSPVLQQQGRGVYCGPRKVAVAVPDLFGSGSLAERVFQHQKINSCEIPSDDCPHYCPNCKHCQKMGETTAEEKEMIERSKATNPDEIDLDGDFESDEEEKVEEIQLEERQVPDEVFGGLKGN